MLVLYGTYRVHDQGTKHTGVGAESAYQVIVMGAAPQLDCVFSSYEFV